MELNSTRIAENHRINDFNSGNAALDAWLRSSALRSDRADISRVVVWAPLKEPDKVIGYFSISPTQINSSDGLPRKYAGGFSVVPAWLLGKLAVDTNFQNKGIGADMLLDALERIVSAAQTGGGRLIVVDPIDDTATQFYAKFGFRDFAPPVTGARATHHPPRQFLPIKDALASLG